MKKTILFIAMMLCTGTAMCVAQDATTGATKQEATTATASAGKPNVTGMKKVYDEKIDPQVQIDKALTEAKAQGKYVICQVGGNWCPWCLKFANFITTDAEIAKAVSDSYVYIHVNYPRGGSRGSNGSSQSSSSTAGTSGLMAVMKKLGNPQRFGFPVFVVLDENGNVVHIQDSSYLENGAGYDKQKVMSFFKNWTKAAVVGS